MLMAKGKNGKFLPHSRKALSTFFLLLFGCSALLCQNVGSSAHYLRHFSNYLRRFSENVRRFSISVGQNFFIVGQNRSSLGAFFNNIRTILSKNTFFIAKTLDSYVIFSFLRIA